MRWIRRLNISRPPDECDHHHKPQPPRPRAGHGKPDSVRTRATNKETTIIGTFVRTSYLWDDYGLASLGPERRLARGMQHVLPLGQRGLVQTARERGIHWTAPPRRRGRRRERPRCASRMLRRRTRKAREEPRRTEDVALVNKANFRIEGRLSKMAACLLAANASTIQALRVGGGGGGGGGRPLPSIDFALHWPPPRAPLFFVRRHD